MKHLALVTTLLSLGLIPADAAGAPLQVQITARYEGFDLARNAEIADINKVPKSGDVLSTPQILTKPGQRCKIEIVREIQVPETPEGEKSVNSGVALDLLPVVTDGKVTLSGTSVLRRRLGQDAAQPLGALSFATHETFFRGEVQLGKELAIAVGDGPNDKARIILTVRLVDPKDVAAR